MKPRLSLAMIALVAAVSGCGATAPSGSGGPGATGPAASASATMPSSPAPDTSAARTAAASTTTAATTASPTLTATTSPASAPHTAGEASVRIFLPNSQLAGDPCSSVHPVQRPLPEGADRARFALEQLLAGPTEAEQKEGYAGWFSAATAGDLIGVRVRGGTAYVDLRDFSATIPNASTSCGSAGLLAQLDATTQAATGADEVRYAFAGDPAAFWDWLQVGCSPGDDDRCDPVPFR